MAINLMDVYSGVDKNDPKRHKNDLYRTPPIATYLLCKYSNPPKKIVEPCAGYGNIAVELIRNGHDVNCFDLNSYPEAMLSIKTGQSALDIPKQSDYDGLITNPPYKNNFPKLLTEKAIAEYDYTALLLRLTFLEGTRRKKLFDKFPPSEIIFFSDRIRFDSDKVEPVEKSEQVGGMICHAWFIWKKNESTATKLTWVSMIEEYDEWRQHYEARNTN
jgi:hypothetical protein